MNSPYPCSGPLQCDSVLTLGTVRFLLTHLPGRAHVDGQGRVWSRNLDADLLALKHWGADAVICLVEPHELTTMGVPDYVNAVARHGMALFQLPITDMSTPSSAFETAWTNQAKALEPLLLGPARVVVHCAAGLGRTGLFCGELLVRAGIPAQEAIQMVRAVRPGAIETNAQEHYLTTL